MDATEAGVVWIGRATIDVILCHAQTTLPNECCGLLIGSEHRIESAFAARNLKASPTRFQVDPIAHFAAIRSARAVGRRVVGAYHSHPTTAPMPSSIDIAEAGPGDDLCVIVTPSRTTMAGSLSDWFGAYRFCRAGVTRVELAVAEATLGRRPR